ncbi:ribosomal protein L6 [Xylona heveae TC161]|uniref:Ribosomal protein L6 n=1 Tax=Xylona heveae (strain CBS 132557 / TC161) TaxID=1328760 RepID=A0A165FKT0_XYLHT|nr:ribosomal protein L6 [Xylona heveae TC161]KZF21092.1 ribosomal protein L6 [Xylona heveae TC161]
MFAISRRSCLREVLSASTVSVSPPPFLLPAFQSAPSSRSFTSSSPCMSQVGRTPISLPPGVSVTIFEPPVPKAKTRVLRTEPETKVEIEGPLGKVSMTLPSFINLEQDLQARKALIRVQDSSIRHQREMWGTTRAYLQNHILGVSEGHTAILRLVGVGYRASVEPSAVTVSPEYEGQQFVSLKVGFSHPVELGVPKGVTASTPQPTRILLEGPDKEIVNEFAANIRAWRRPEPYKGKGIFVNGETIKLKAKKIK